MRPRKEWLLCSQVSSIYYLAEITTSIHFKLECSSHCFRCPAMGVEQSVYTVFNSFDNRGDTIPETYGEKVKHKPYWTLTGPIYQTTKT